MQTKHSSTHRGFGLVEFQDAYEAECSIQESSAVGNTAEEHDRPGSSYLWIGVDDPKPQILASQTRELGLPTAQQNGWVPFVIPEQVQMTTRMHLSREQVQQLIPILEYWLQLGYLPPEPIKQDAV